MKAKLFSLCALAALLGCTAFSSQAADMMFKHQTRGINCLMCHQTAAPSTPAKSSSCKTCHTYDSVAQKTAKKNPNPHDSHAGQMRCTKCHHEHKPSVNACAECHATGEKFQFKVP